MLKTKDTDPRIIADNRPRRGQKLDNTRWTAVIEHTTLQFCGLSEGLMPENETGRAGWSVIGWVALGIVLPRTLTSSFRVRAVRPSTYASFVLPGTSDLNCIGYMCCPSGYTHSFLQVRIALRVSIYIAVLPGMELRPSGYTGKLFNR